ncbi:ArsR/SmtB family transcription factor [Haloarchaeobius iranensis]|uniref:Helix-turn-helix domain-containing protein n=1 Tax=Haloarchaeobius iranensis TaxID=996166 RepID=A0A1G9SFA4_9EURY|nr:helix-turn-helix domain-containing protein [Haloarchaeobius iranensis]SDM34166.1 Helix-turn-helix domain-containing protein [Haloarchaeobius iranensis]
MAADEPDSARDAADAFSLLGDASRLAILDALHEARGTPLAFAELHRRVDVRDSAKFNYHLKQLRPRFVAKADDGYELTAAGRRLARAVTAGRYTDEQRLEPFDIAGECIDCGASALSAAYEDERFTVTCAGCDATVLAVRMPPTVVRERDPEEVVDAFDRWSRLGTEQAAQGLCGDCGGVVEPSVTEDVHESIRYDALAVFDCTVCGRRTMTSFGALASRHPDVEAFHRERGISLRERPYWEVSQYVTDEHVEYVSRDPWCVHVRFHADGDSCLVELDGDLAVVRTEVVEGVSED